MDEIVAPPVGVSVTQEWGVHSDDGEVYRVWPSTREKAEHEAALLREREPGASPASRYVMDTPQGQASTGWRWTIGRCPPRT